MILYNVILSLDHNYQQDIIKAVRSEIAQGKQKYSRNYTKMLLPAATNQGSTESASTNQYVT